MENMFRSFLNYPSQSINQSNTFANSNQSQKRKPNENHDTPLKKRKCSLVSASPFTDKTNNRNCNNNQTSMFPKVSIYYFFTTLNLDSNFLIYYFRKRMSITLECGKRMFITLECGPLLNTSFFFRAYDGMVKEGGHK